MEAYTDVLGNRTQDGQQLFSATIQAQEQERRRIALSLHNGLCQMLYGVKLKLQSLEKQLQENPEFRDTVRLLSEAISEARKLSHQLMPNALEKHGLKKALWLICEQFNQSMEVDFTFNGFHGKIQPHIEIALYRTVQELMLNVIKHAEATHVKLELVATHDNVKIRVKDNGKGFSGTAISGGQGLDAIKTQIDLLGGTLSISTVNGTEVSVQLPLAGSRTDTRKQPFATGGRQDNPSGLIRQHPAGYTKPESSALSFRKMLSHSAHETQGQGKVLLGKKFQHQKHSRYSRRNKQHNRDRLGA